ncbi:hypothetical protein ABZT49_19820 [Methylobacterium sp. EM32]|uniref:hypothetical protein n=1 Tax=Methylobacterium sp. EM32 TaxID=3163481 RepID=UPI0033B259EA
MFGLGEATQINRQLLPIVVVAPLLLGSFEIYAIRSNLLEPEAERPVAGAEEEAVGDDGGSNPAGLCILVVRG